MRYHYFVLLRKGGEGRGGVRADRVKGGGGGRDGGWCFDTPPLPCQGHVLYATPACSAFPAIRVAMLIKLAPPPPRSLFDRCIQDRPSPTDLFGVDLHRGASPLLHSGMPTWQGQRTETRSGDVPSRPTPSRPSPHPTGSATADQPSAASGRVVFTEGGTLVGWLQGCKGSRCQVLTRSWRSFRRIPHLELHRSAGQVESASFASH